MRLLAFDFGTAHIGVACGNDETGTVEALGALRARDGRPDERDLMRLKEQWQPQHLVVGLPLMADGSTQPLTARARRFGNRLAQLWRLKVSFVDERYTTVAARALIYERDGRGRKLFASKDTVDGVSAAEILRQYLASRETCAIGESAPTGDTMATRDTKDTGDTRDKAGAAPGRGDGEDADLDAGFSGRWAAPLGQAPEGASLPADKADKADKADETDEADEADEENASAALTPELEALLNEVERELRALQLWADELPDEKALLSEMPFCLDTLELHEWLQFVLLPRLRAGTKLPGKLSVHPLAEELWRGRWAQRRHLLRSLRRLDEFFAGSGTDYA